MKTHKTWIVSALLALAGTMAVPWPAKSQEPVSLDFFYETLEPYGSWVEVSDYGYCWMPDGVDQYWRPYADGQWVYTDAGWTWVSDEPFGWAVYHYGRWADVENLGWVWVPGTEWGPGWVSWRHNEEYTGWAPLPPEAAFQADVGFSGWVDDYYDIGPGSYCFVDNRNFGQPRVRNYFVDRGRNVSLVFGTTNVTQVTYRDQMVCNGGPSFDFQSRHSSVPIRRYRLERRWDHNHDYHDHHDHDRPGDNSYYRPQTRGDTLSMLAAPLIAKAVGNPRIAKHIERALVDRGWRDAGPSRDVSDLRERIRNQSQARRPAALPDKPRFEKHDDHDHHGVADRIPGREGRPAIKDIRGTDRERDHKTGDHQHEGRPTPGRVEMDRKDSRVSKPEVAKPVPKPTPSRVEPREKPTDRGGKPDADAEHRNRGQDDRRGRESARPAMPVTPPQQKAESGRDHEKAVPRAKPNNAPAKPSSKEGVQGRKSPPTAVPHKPAPEKRGGGENEVRARMETKPQAKPRPVENKERSAPRVEVRSKPKPPAKPEAKARPQSKPEVKPEAKPEARRGDSGSRSEKPKPKPESSNRGGDKKDGKKEDKRGR